MDYLIKKWTESNLILKIICGFVIGTVLGILIKKNEYLGLPGELFIKALRGIAPILVFALVSSYLSKANKGIGNRFKIAIILYLLCTFLSALIAVCASFICKIKMPLKMDEPEDFQYTNEEDNDDDNSIGKILKNILLKIFENPLISLSQGEYLGILFWAIVIGYCLKKKSNESTINMLSDFADVMSFIVRGIIQFAPIGIMGLVYNSVSESGLKIFYDYGKLILIDVVCVFIIIFIINPFLVAIVLRRNPYPLIFRCLWESGITAFFTRSSAANIPVNLELCKKLGLDKDFYSISIPLGATINMGGAAINITIMTLSLCYGLDIKVKLGSSFFYVLFLP
jgi:serine/threonine transporter